MKLVLLFSFMVLRFVGGDEVRGYDVSIDVLRRAQVANYDFDGKEPDPFAAGGEIPEDDYYLTGIEWLGPEVKAAGFESRFLKEAGELRECWRRVEEAVGYDDFEGKAVYDVKNGRLIVKGGVGLHRALRRSIENEMPIQLRATYSVYEMPGVGLEDRSGFWDEVPKEGKLLREISWLALPGSYSEASSADGSIWAASDLQMDAYDSYVAMNVTLAAELPEGGFSWRTGFPGVIGLSWAQEVGSLDGETTLMLVSRIDQTRTNGGLWDEWVLNEEGAFMHDERLEVIRPWRPSELPDDLYVEERQFTVPPTFERFLTIMGQDEDDPFAAGDDAGGKLVPIRKLLEQNGITFREGDSVAFLRSSSTLIARLSKDNLELLDGLLNAEIGTGPPEVWSLELVEIEGEDFRKGRLLRKIGVSTLEGQETEVRLGEDLALKFTMQVDADDELAELRVKLSEEEGDLEQASLTTGVEVRVGQPTVLRATVVNGRQRSWVATARLKVLENEVEALLKRREGGK